jgi:hypothetical protein
MSNCKRPIGPCKFDRFSTSCPRTSFELNGPASLANGEIARRLPTHYSKSTFSGAARRANDAATAGYFVDSNVWFPEIGTRWRMTQSAAKSSLASYYLDNQGKYRESPMSWSLRFAFDRLNDLSKQIFAARFPTPPNREFFRRNREFSAGTGNSSNETLTCPDRPTRLPWSSSGNPRDQTPPRAVLQARTCRCADASGGV